MVIGGRVLVTGGSGFLGSFVVPLLVDRGYEVSALVRSPSAARAVSDLKAEPLAGDLDDPASLDDAFSVARADGLVNLASLGFGHAPAIVAAAEASGVRRGVFVSTTAIFTTLPAASKATRTAAEQAVQVSGLDWTILRPAMIYGSPRDRNLSRLLTLLRRAPIVPVPGGGRRLQQPVHAADLSSAVVAALECPTAVRRCYDIAGPAPLTFRELLIRAGDAVGRRPLLVPVPLRPCIGALRLYERLSRHARLKAEQLERLAEDKSFDIADARRDLGYDPRPFAQGIREEAALLG